MFTFKSHPSLFLQDGPHIFTLVATDDQGQTASITPIIITFERPPNPGYAAFVATDATTGGNWAPNYGSAGYDIAGDSDTLQYNLRVSPAASFLWAANTTAKQALERAGGGVLRRPSTARPC
jgi:hypothetical protein